MTPAPVSPMTATEIAATIGGAVVGPPDVTVEGIAPLDRASSGDLSFFATSGYAAMFEASSAGIVLVAPQFAQHAGRCATRVVVAKPHDAMVALIPRFYRVPVRESGVHPTAIVAPSASIGADARIEAYAVIGDDAVIGDRAWIGSHSVIGDGVRIGDDARLFPHVTLYSGADLGHRVIIHSGTRIACDGYGYRFRDGAHQRIPHVGRCIIGNDVEIGGNCVLDRGSIDDTVIGDGTKFDNLVHIGHNIRIGRLCLIMAQVGMAGSTRVEDGVMLAGQVGVSGHLTIGAWARVAGQGGVISDIPAGETWSGYPARPHREYLRAMAVLFKLPAMIKKLERLIDRNGR